MITFGYAKGYKYTGDGTLMIKTRIPSIHGAYSLQDYKGKVVKNYTQDNDLPWFQSILLPHLPQEGEIVAVATLDDGNSTFLVIGLTGGSYQPDRTNLGG